MKKITVLFVGLFAAACVLAQEFAWNTEKRRSTVEEAAFKWETLEHDFGQIKLNVPVSHEFSFTNSGSIPLIISSVQGSCGCTVTSYTKDPIEPGQTGFVKATFNAASLGQFTKTVTVTANTAGGATRLIIKGEVIK